MAEAQAPAATTSKPLQLGQARIAGRIESSRRKTGQSGAMFFTLFALPAADRFSHPATVEVVSSERLGASGDELSIVVAVSGYGRSVTPKDPNESAYRTADNRLAFVAFA